jgi:hypothetical protein
LLDGTENGCPIDAQLRAFSRRGDITILPRVLFGERAGGPPRRLDRLFLIDGRNATPSIESCSPYGVLPALMRSVICRESGLERAARFVAAFGQIPTYRLRLGTPSATAAAIARCLDEPDSGARR